MLRQNGQRTHARTHPRPFCHSFSSLSRERSSFDKRIREIKGKGKPTLNNYTTLNTGDEQSGQLKRSHPWMRSCGCTFLASMSPDGMIASLWGCVEGSLLGRDSGFELSSGPLLKRRSLDCLDYAIGTCLQVVQRNM